MSPSILVLNAGSSSLKFGIYPVGSDTPLCRGVVDWAGREGVAELHVSGPSCPETKITVSIDNHGDAVGVSLRACRAFALQEASLGFQIVAVGHRVVHGGTSFRESFVIDQRVRDAIAKLASLAPLHNPPALAAMEAAAAALPDLPQVAMFDTAFFADFPPQAYLYPVPYEWFTDWGIRRFGFHGISHQYCSQRAAQMLGRPISELRLVVCHLGNGCSASAIAGGKANSTTMGFTPMDGLMMGTRPGSLDPGILLHIQQQHGVTAESLQQDLNHLSGLRGISGSSSDVRQLEAAVLAGNERARLALGMYTDRIRSMIGALTVTLGGLDALVFTAGVGEHSTGVRRDACQNLECLGLHLDPDLNSSARPDTDIATHNSPSRILVIECREDLLIAQETTRLLRLSPVGDRLSSAP